MWRGYEPLTVPSPSPRARPFYDVAAGTRRQSATTTTGATYSERHQQHRPRRIRPGAAGDGHARPGADRNTARRRPAG